MLRWRRERSRPMAPLRLIVRMLWLPIAAALTLVPLAAQHHTSVSGMIRDPSDSAVPGASITAVQEETGFRRAATSGPAGGYLIATKVLDITTLKHSSCA